MNKTIVSILIGTTLLAGCQRQTVGSAFGAGIGSAVGVVGGFFVGGATGAAVGGGGLESLVMATGGALSGAVIGGVVGGVGGSQIGNQMATPNQERLLIEKLIREKEAGKSDEELIEEIKLYPKISNITPEEFEAMEVAGFSHEVMQALI
ncbi:MAG: hypothetical protein MRY21_06645 [Simkaniaceae bacterium]|nr:hypothetical protein [Simkaniaceae bacterium]